MCEAFNAWRAASLQAAVMEAQSELQHPPAQMVQGFYRWRMQTLINRLQLTVAAVCCDVIL